MTYPESPFWTENDAMLRKLAQDGLSAKKISDELGCTRNAVIGRCHREGIPLKGQAAVCSQEAIDLARKLYVDRVTYEEISRRTGIPKGSIGFHVHGLKKRRVSKKPKKIRYSKVNDRVLALAALVAAELGESQNLVSKRMRFKRDCWRFWRLDEDLIRMAKAKAVEMKTRYRERQATIKAQQRAEINRINAPIMEKIPTAHRIAMLHRVNGKTQREAGAIVGISGARIGQIERRWVAYGLIIPSKLDDPAPIKDEAFWSEKIALAISAHPIESQESRP